MKHNTTLDSVAFILIIIGGINWGLVGVFNFNLVNFLFGAGSIITRIIYIVIGIAALYAIYALSDQYGHLGRIAHK